MFFYCSRCGELLRWHMGTSPNQQFHRKDETYLIRGAAFHVYRCMGAGFLEAVYQECLAIEFERRGIPFNALAALSLTYDGEPLKQRYIADFVCFGDVIVELKAAKSLLPEHRAQTLNYMRAANMKIGLLMNFSSMPGMEIERFSL